MIERFECDDCGEEFWDELDLSRHISRVHMDNSAQDFHCTHCLVGYHHQDCVYAYGKMKERTDPRPLPKLKKREREQLTAT